MAQRKSNRAWGLGAAARGREERARAAYRPLACIMAVLFALTASVRAQVAVRPQSFSKNGHVRYATRVEGGDFIVEYTFRDHREKTRKAVLRFDAEQMLRDIDRFGIPSAWLGYLSERERRRMRRSLEDGFFRQEGWTIVIDYPAAVAFYAPDYGRPIAEQIVTTLASEGCDTRMDRIEFAMKFVQDIPYGIPVFSDRRKEMGGAMPPPLTLRAGFGDCDTKSMLFASIMCYLVPATDIVLLKTRDHVLSAVRSAEPPAGRARTWYLEFEGFRYYLAETAGPARLGFGEETLGYLRVGVENIAEAWESVPSALPYGKPLAGVPVMKSDDGTIASGERRREERVQWEWVKKEEDRRDGDGNRKTDEGGGRRREDTHSRDDDESGATIPHAGGASPFTFRAGLGVRYLQGDLSDFTGTVGFGSRLWSVSLAACTSLSRSSALEISGALLIAGRGAAAAQSGEGTQAASAQGNAPASWEAAVSLVRHRAFRIAAGYGEDQAAQGNGNARPYFLGGFFFRMNIRPFGVEVGAEVLKHHGCNEAALRLGLQGFVQVGF
ncbi:MAG: hypothetical protein QHI48_06150 [Bacteroidota bacterium]|nr:hypothetical protein [Bacteroidota bacterium]